MRMKILLKIIAVFLVLTLGIQQTGFATVYDLRDTASGGDFTMAIVMGFISGSLSNPNLNTGQMFVRTYLIPEGAKAINKMLGIKDKYGIFTVMLATFFVSAMDYKAAAEAKAAGLEEKAKALGVDLKTFLAQENSKVSLWGGFKKSVSDFLDTMKGNTKRDIIRGAMVDAISAGVIQASKVYAAKVIARADDRKNRAWRQFMLNLATLYLGHYARQALQRELSVYLGYDPDYGPTATNEKDLARELSKQNWDFNQQMKGEWIYGFFEALSNSEGWKGGKAAAVKGLGLGLKRAGGDIGKTKELYRGIELGLINDFLQRETRKKRQSDAAMLTLAGSTLAQYYLHGGTGSLEDALGMAGAGAYTDMVYFGRASPEVIKTPITELKTISGRWPLWGVGPVPLSAGEWQLEVPVIVGYSRAWGLKWHSGNDVFTLSKYGDYINNYNRGGFKNAFPSSYSNAYSNQSSQRDKK